ncbi:hypothetical protein IMSHALPRED_006938 [Imshaugia aleurites]|uniref:Methyltransferase domain-containing protein n=1 Tax=Imshaugia aleurites TaxID=172621 RepID=A0A8H3FI17_9LECA|nr:hypothetical protein IMSHALPRED_006938 [Imshaugia aleurites]
MTSATDYVFTRDYVDNNRYVDSYLTLKRLVANGSALRIISINLQHYLSGELFGYLTHPDIPTRDPHLKIADVGTGTGIWLTELGGRLPKSVHLDGLDISFHATPPAQWLPSNMTLRLWDVKAHVPEDLAGRYDIVHIRNFAFVLQSDDIQHVLDNLIKLIRPGGYLQWAEPDVASFRIEKTKPENNVDALRQLLHLSQGQDARLSPTWVPNLTTLFTNSGLGDVQSDARDAPPHLALAMHECSLPIHELIARKTQNEGVTHALTDLMPEIAKETREGSCWAFTRWIVIGRKPRECA